jgi:hypothetical protein
MLVRRIILISLSLAFLTQAVLAESASYHLKRLEIQTRAFLAQLDEPSVPVQPEGMPVEEQLDVRVNNESTWAEDMAREDLASILSSTPVLLESLRSRKDEEYSKARVELESLARRLRISTSPLELNPQQQASLDLLMLELEEATTILSHEREQLLTQRESQRRRRRVSVGVGYGWGGWSPWGYNTWGGYNGPYYGGYYRPRRIYRRPYCR